ncbi:MAG: hypothetical protein ACRCX8_16470 [Sarcina sp.]
MINKCVSLDVELSPRSNVECDINVGRGERGDTVELRLFEGWVQWKQTEKDVWENIISVDDLNGRSIEYQWNGTSLGVRIEGDTEYTFVNLKGEKGDTPSISHLESAISEKLSVVDGVINEVNANEVIRISNENTRISSESDRVSSENQRVADENIRKANEVIRQTQEASRQESMTNIEGRFDSKIIEVDSKIAESSKVILDTNAVKDATESVRITTELVKNETIVVKDDTVVVKNATNIVKSETEAVKNNTESVRIATETAKEQAESKIVDCETRMKHIEDNFDNLVGGTGFATTVYVDNKVGELVSSAPETLDTLKELADALGNDPNFATTVSTEIGKKADKSDTYTKSEVDGIVNSKTQIDDLNVSKSTVWSSDKSKGEIDKKMDIHTHPYKSDSYVPSWGEIDGKPSSFNPSGHRHSISEIDNLSMDAGSITYSKNGCTNVDGALDKLFVELNGNRAALYEELVSSIGKL